MISLVIAGTDAGWGDGGKGAVTDYLCAKFRPKYVIKEGGAQGSHGAFTNTGEKFNFSQWGCGSFHGIPTYLSPRMVISPTGLLNESDALKHCGFYDPFAMLSADPSCICATPYHQIWSLIYEMLLRDAPHGTVGTGVGKAYRYRIVSADKLYGHGRMYAKVVLQPGSTIGWHQHIHETEPYYILSGEGTFIDNDKSKTTVHAGDICTIEPGQWHSMENNGQEDLVFMALIYND